MLLKSVFLCNKDCHFDEIGNDVNTKGEFSYLLIRRLNSGLGSSAEGKKKRALFYVKIYQSYYKGQGILYTSMKDISAGKRPLIMKVARIKIGLKQAEVAKAVGITQATYSRMENGVTQPPYETLKKLSEVLGVNINRLTRRV